MAHPQCQHRRTPYRLRAGAGLTTKHDRVSASRPVPFGHGKDGSARQTHGNAEFKHPAKATGRSGVISPQVQQQPIGPPSSSRATAR